MGLQEDGREESPGNSSAKADSSLVTDERKAGWVRPGYRGNSQVSVLVEAGRESEYRQACWSSHFGIRTA